MNNEEQDPNQVLEQNISPYIQPYFRGPIRRLAPKMSRNEYCHINNIKFKKCCGADGSDFCKRLLMDYIDQIKEKHNLNGKDDKIS